MAWIRRHATAKSKVIRNIKPDTASFLRRVLEMLLPALAVTLIVECFNQAGLPRLFSYMHAQLPCFLLNLMIVLTSMSLSELVRRRLSVLVLVTILWLLLGFTNYMVIHSRTLPLSSADLIPTWEVFRMITIYFSWFEILAMFLGGAGVLVAIIWLFINLPRRAHVNRVFGLIFVGAIFALTFLFRTLLVQTGHMPREFADRANSYREYGFTSCFTLTFGQMGIGKPDEYSPQAVDDILGGLNESEADEQRFDDASAERPNIIFVQLESFFDTTSLTDAELSRDPIPNFHRLMRDFPSGELYVPTIGGGTANVEFEIMSGFNMDFFGTGETPYNTIIQETSCETIADVLRLHGYSSTALHNNTGTFFSRNQVYANLGFDRFDCLETMPSPKYNDIGWAKDDILTGEILRALDTTPERDLLFAITVSSHGKYADTYLPRNGDIQVLRAPEEIYLAPFQNYVNLIEDVDAFLGCLIDALKSYDEPVVAIIYGDHLPGLGLKPEMLANEDYYASRYIIWNNFGASFDAPNLQAYRLSAELLRQLGISDGVMNKFHSSYSVNDVSEEYLESLHVLEYDLLYGDQNAYGASGAPRATQLQMGIEPVRIRAAELEYGRLLVTGEHFTEYSRVIADEEALSTVYIDESHIAVWVDTSIDEFPDEICVAQMTADGKELCRTAGIHVVKHAPHQ